jgi:hypothetical protein
VKLWQRTLIQGAVEIGLLLAAHRLLIGYMAGHDVASKVFAAGPHVPKGTLAIAGVFLLVRILAVVALPGMILARVGLVIHDRVTDRRRRDDGSRQPAEHVLLLLVCTRFFSSCALTTHERSASDAAASGADVYGATVLHHARDVGRWPEMAVFLRKEAEKLSPSKGGE